MPWIDAIAFDDIDNDAALFADRGSLHNGAQRIGCATTATDHLAVIVLANNQFEHYRAVVVVELFNDNCGWVVN